MLLHQYSPGWCLAVACMVSLLLTADRCRVIVWKLRSSSLVTSVLFLLWRTTWPKTSSIWRPWKLPCCRAMKDKTTSWGKQKERDRFPLSLFCLHLEIHKWINHNPTWHCPGAIVPLEGLVVKCANFRKRKLMGSWGQRFCSTHSKSTRWPVTQVKKSNLWEGLGTRETGSPEPVTANSTLLLPKGNQSKELG